MQKNIVVRGAKEHNLKNISVELPRDKLIVITGLSGSGKSTLAFDTIYAEGQRRYVESLSAYARQFLGIMNKPQVESIDGLSPAISIEQKTTSKNPRSTVGTITEIYDYLRLLWARIGNPVCPKHNIPLDNSSPQQIVDRISETFGKEDLIILAPLVSEKKGTYEKLVEDLNKEGFTRVRIDGVIQRTDEKPKLARYKKHTIEVVIDRCSIEDISRLTQAVEQAIERGEGRVIVHTEEKEQMYSAKMACPKCDFMFEELQPRMFSFNSPFGACESCHGLGFHQEIDEELIIPDPTLSIADGAIQAYRNHIDGWRVQQLGAVAKAFGFTIFDPINKLTKQQRKALLYGTDEAIKFRYDSKKRGSSYTFNKDWEGVIPQLERLYAQTESDYRKKEIEKFMQTKPCPACKGRRLKEKVLTVRIGGKNIIEVTDLNIEKALEFFKSLTLTKQQMAIAKQVLKEITDRLTFLKNVGLTYLTLSRRADTLSGGEAQRIRLATQIGSNLTGVLYILDEPSIGLHQRDNNRLIETLHRLRDLGNTLIVVEHDEDTIKNADYVIDMGPGAGRFGGDITARGTVAQIMKNKKSLTGQYLTKKKTIPVPKERREPKSWLKLKGASQFNLKNIDVEIPTGVLTFITGVSGSGKSTLMHEVLYKALMKKIYKSKVVPGKHKSIDIPKELDKVVLIDQSPIGRTPRSNPATYTKLFDDIRSLFAETRDSKVRGFKPGRFSFNVKGGRCEACQGEGVKKIEMHFLADVFVECEVCKGKRFNNETLEVRYKGKNISDVLEMTVAEAVEFFASIPNIHRKLQTLADVGLDYLKLGQSSTTLSGGEAQRIKLTRELAKRDTGNTLYLLDEPTTGLHFEDVNKLIEVINRLVNKGNTVLIIEHNLDMIKNGDHIVDIGPEGGDGGGKIVASGTPEAIVKAKTHTGRFLKDVL